MQYRLEIDHLKSELQDDKNKIQQLERELLEIKLKQLSNNETSVDVNFSE
jgi:predicted RNase H-like nuclease (RuvC/YqgF family)